MVFYIYIYIYIDRAGEWQFSVKRSFSKFKLCDQHIYIEWQQMRSDCCVFDHTYTCTCTAQRIMFPEFKRPSTFSVMISDPRGLMHGFERFVFQSEYERLLWYRSSQDSFSFSFCFCLIFDYRWSYFHYESVMKGMIWLTFDSKGYHKNIRGLS